MQQPNFAKLLPLVPVLFGPMILRHSVLSAIAIVCISTALWLAVREVPLSPQHRKGLGVASASLSATITAVLVPRGKQLLLLGATHGDRPAGAPLPSDEREQAGHALEVGLAWGVRALRLLGDGWAVGRRSVRCGVRCATTMPCATTALCDAPRAYDV